MRFMLTSLIIIATLGFMSCAKDRTARASDPPRAAEPPREIMDDQYEVPPPRDTMSKVMAAKLANAQAILEGVALADYSQIETNALALKRISQGGDWLVHDSATYYDFSTEFRGICDDIVNHARAQNLEAVAGDYANLANSCVACHGYLRMERQTKDMPGRVSMGLE
jgi:hypothetical protein